MLLILIHFSSPLVGRMIHLGLLISFENLNIVSYLLLHFSRNQL